MTGISLNRLPHYTHVPCSLVRYAVYFPKFPVQRTVPFDSTTGQLFFHTYCSIWRKILPVFSTQMESAQTVEWAVPETQEISWSTAIVFAIFLTYNLIYAVLRCFHCLIKNNTQTAVINIINLRIIYKLDVSYASQHTFSKVPVTIF